VGVSTGERIDLIVVADLGKRTHLVEELAVPGPSADPQLAGLGSGRDRRGASLLGARGHLAPEIEGPHEPRVDIDERLPSGSRLLLHPDDRHRPIARPSKATISFRSPLNKLLDA
jgi:hypothetical protein